MRDITQGMVDCAMDLAYENGYCVISDDARRVAIDLVTYDAEFEALVYGRYNAGLDDGTEANKAIEQVTTLVQDWQRRKLNGS